METLKDPEGCLPGQPSPQPDDIRQGDSTQAVRDSPLGKC